MQLHHGKLPTPLLAGPFVARTVVFCLEDHAPRCVRTDSIALSKSNTTRASPDIWTQGLEQQAR
jgi:hypothetical protein